MRSGWERYKGPPVGISVTINVDINGDIIVDTTIAIITCMLVSER